MATSRPIRRGEWLTHIQGHNIGMTYKAAGDENPVEYVRQEDFAIQDLLGQRCAQEACVRIFGVAWPPSEDAYQAAITNGTAPGLYVREGDDTSDWETYRQVLARRVEEAMAARRGDEVTATRPSSPPIHECPWCYNSRRITHSQDDDGRICPYCFDWPEVVQAREDAAALAAARAMPTATTRQDDEIRVGDVVEVVSNTEVAVSDEMRRRLSSPLISSSDETTRQRVVNPIPSTAGVYIGPATIRFGDRAFTGTITATDSLRRGEPPVASSVVALSPPPPTIPPPPPSRFSLLEVDLPPEPTSSTRRSLDADLAALQDELRAERERNRALAAAQEQKSRFDLLECDLPAPARGPTPCRDTAPQTRPVVSPPPKPRNPVETITDLTTARSPLELARMLESLNDELSSMMRQREVN